MKNRDCVKINHKIISKYLYFSNKILGLNNKSSDYLIKSLIGSSLRGVDSHGLRLYPHYVSAIIGGRINKKPKMKFKMKTTSACILDANNGLGHHASYIAADKVSKIASKTGIGIVGIINSSHNAAAGAYSIEIAKNNCIGLSFTHSDAMVSPHGGYKKFNGTNPYSFCAPLKNGKFFLVDFATSNIPWNKVLRARGNNWLLSEELSLDKKGRMTTNPHLADSLYPLGGISYGHKGFGLSSSIEILCGPLTGMMHGFKLLPMSGPDFKTYRKLGHILIAIKTDIFQSKTQYYKRISNYIDDLKKQKSNSKKKQIYFPGELENLEEKKRIKNGIPFDKEMIKEYSLIDKKLKINKFKSILKKI